MNPAGSSEPSPSIRPVTAADDLQALGRIVLTSYTRLPGHPADAEYDASLVDIADRLRTNTVFGAFAGSKPLGCVTFVADASDPHAEKLQPHEASFRMLAVAPEAQGRGIGATLVWRCLQAAPEVGKTAMFIYSGDWMPDAHRLYLRLGFERVEDRDWRLVDPPVTLMGFHHDLGGSPRHT